MRFSNAVKQSLHDFRAHPKVIVPEVLSLLMVFLGVYVFLVGSGLLPFIGVYAEAVQSYDPFSGVSEEAFIVDALGGTAFTDVLLRLDVLYLGLAMFCTILVLQAFFACWSFSLVTLIRTGKDPRFGDALAMALRFFVRFLLIRLTLIFAVYGPLFLVLLLGLVAGLLWHPLFFVPAALLALIGGIPYMLFVLTRFLFAGPLLFLKKRRVVKTLQGTFRLTGKSFWYAFVILLIATVFAMLYQYGGSRPLWFVFARLVLLPDLTSKVFLILAAFLFLVVGAFALTMEQLYVFNSYQDYVKHVKM